MYIDFYDSTKVNKYRVNLAEVYPNYKTITKNGYVIRLEGQNRYKINSLGSSLVDVFNIKNLDFTKQSEYSYYNNDKTLMLTITLDSTRSVHQNYKGLVITGNQEYEPVIAYDSNTIDIVLYYINKSNMLTTSTPIFLGDSFALTLPNPPDENYGNYYSPTSFALDCTLGTYPIEYENTTIYCYVLLDTTTYKPTMIFSGSMASTDNNESKTTPTGVIMTKAGTNLKGQIIPNIINQKTENSTGKIWDAYDKKFVIYGLGLVPTTPYLYNPQSSLNFRGIYDYRDTSKGQPDNTDPNPQYPEDDNPQDDNPEDSRGGDGDGDKESDPIPDYDTVQSFNPTGLITIYKLAQASLNTLGQKLWSDNFLSKFLKITQNPIDAIIELKAFYFNISSSTTKNLTLGNFDTEIIANTVQDTIVEIDFENIAITEFFGDFKDYNPFTKISIFLPFIGVRDLNINEIMGSVINLTYHIDILSNNCVALITVSKNIDGTQLNSVLYQFEGNCAQNIPISAASANTIIAARLSQLNSINTAVRQIGNTSFNDKMSDGQKGLNIGTSIVNSGLNIMSQEINANHLDVARTGSLNGSTGILGILTPYIIIERCISDYPSSFSRVMGVTSNRTLLLSNCEGFTQISKIFISNFTGTQNEYQELQALLMEGVVF